MQMYLGRRIGNSKLYGGIGINVKPPAPKPTPLWRGFKFGLWLSAGLFLFFLWKVAAILVIGWIAGLLVPRTGRPLRSARY